MFLHYRHYLLTFFVSVLAVTAWGQSTNLLLNPSFESGMVNWAHSQSGTATVVSNPSLAHSGSNYAELTLAGSTAVTGDHLTSSGGSGMAVFYAVGQGDTLAFGGWAMLVSGNGITRYTLALYDSSKTSKGYVSTPSVTNATWTQANSTYVVPSGISYVKFYAEVYDPSTNTTARFDDASLTDSPAVLQSISVAPNPASVASGTVQFSATGTYSGGMTKDVTTAVSWASSATSVATISNASGSQGLATAVTGGTATISASVGSLSDSSVLTVTMTATLQSLTVTPGYSNISSGTQQLTATGNYSDGSTQDLTTSVTWSSSNSAIATISNDSGSQGLATSIGQIGATVISASSGGVIGATTFSVSGSGNLLANASLESGNARWVHGGTGTAGAVNNPANANTGSEYAELNIAGSTSVTQDVLYSADTTNTAVFYPVKQGDTLTFGGWANLVTGSAAVRFSIAVYDANKSNPVYVSSAAVSTNTWTQITATYLVPAGRSYVKFYAQIYNPTTTTTARFDDAYLFDTPASLLSISVTPDPTSIVVGASQQYTATGSYNGGMTQDITDSVTWGSSSTSVATINNSGLAMAVGAGGTSISASSGSVSGPASLTVTSAPTLMSLAISPAYPNIPGGTEQFTATGSFNDGSTKNVSSSVTWSSSSTAVATISNSAGSQGWATSGGQVGATKITAASGSIHTSTILSVSSKGNVLPNPSFEGGTLNWVHAATGTATVVNTPANANTGNKYAQLSLPGSTSVTQDVLYSADGSGNAVFYPVSQGQVLTFGGWADLVGGNGLLRFSLAVYDGNKANPVYVSSPAVNTNSWTQVNATYIVPAGRSYVKFYAQIYNPTTNTTGWVDDAYLLVSPPVLQSISVTPTPASIVISNTQQFAATGAYTGGLLQNITTSVTWSSSSSTVATISNSGGSQGLATGTGAGTATITAALGTVSGSASLTVTSVPALLSITVTPTNPVISGSTQQFTATGSYNDGSTQNVTTAVTWSSAYPAVATISNSSGSQGLATSTGQVGTTTITATSGSISGSTVLSVSMPGSLQSIRHIIFLSQENRSFDSYFGQMGTYRQVNGYTDPFNGTPNKAIPDKAGVLIAPFHFQTVCEENTTPSWNGSHDYRDQSKLDRFMVSGWQLTSTIDPNVTRDMGYYDWTDLPYYYATALQFATSDTYFGSLLGPTGPNRFYMLTGTSFGHIRSDSPPSGTYYKQPTIFDALSKAGVSWRYYYQDVHHNDLAMFSTYQVQTSVPISNFFTDIQNEATLPSVLYIDRRGDGGYDEHPNTDIQLGALNTAQIINAVMQSPAWPSTVFILTWDEAGGLYEHVNPPAAVLPDSIPPMLQTGDWNATFNEYGYRVPVIVISPWIKPHFVSHVVRDHTSWLKLVETRFGISSLTARDQNADNMTEFFDFSSPHWLTPPQLPVQPTNGKCSYNLERAPGQ